MKRLLITILIGLYSSIVFNCFAAEQYPIQVQPYDAIINLGGDCQPSYQMYQNGLRKYALPFDSLITPCDSLLKIIEEQFDDFLNKENLELIIQGNQKFIIDKKYNIRLIHDFKLEEDYLNDYEIIKEKYERRINRFMELMENSRSILFIRKVINLKQANRLAKMIEWLYPHLDFTILALDGTDEIKQAWNIYKVENRFLRQPNPYVWKGDTQAWKEIFQEMGLELYDAQASTNEH